MLYISSFTNLNDWLNLLKRATKLCFIYSRVVSILFSTGSYKSAFSTYSFGKSRFWSFVFLYFWLLIFHVLNSMSSQKTYIVQSGNITNHVPFNFVLTLFKRFVKNYVTKTCFQRGFEFIKKNFIRPFYTWRIKGYV